MRGRHGIRAAAVGLCGAAMALAGCGEDRQDADEPSGTYRVQVSGPEFPRAQHLAEQSTFQMRVRNTGEETIPALAVTLRGFAARPAPVAGSAGGENPESTGAGASERTSDPERPVWVVDEEPAGGVTAYDDTWTAGSLAPGRTATLRWRVTPVVAGRHTLRYTVSAGLDGKAKAIGSGGRRPTGALNVTIDDEPAAARVDPATGDVERGVD